MSRRFHVAAAAYPIEALADWDAYAAKITAWVDDAAGQGAALLVFPEYGAMEIERFAGGRDLASQVDAVAAYAAEADALHARLAESRGVHILAGSLPVRLADGRAANRARLFSPEGRLGVQDKQIMTRWEREVWSISGAPPLRVFETTLGRIGVLICYDVEFPLLARAMVEAGVELLLVPSCRETLGGYWRVRIGAMARALEGQCYAVMASTVGAAPWSEIVDENVGAGGIFAPPDKGWAGAVAEDGLEPLALPDDGVIAVGAVNAPGWTVAQIDLDHIAAARSGGRVFGVAHWPEQYERLATPIETERLSG